MKQANLLKRWLKKVSKDYADADFAIDEETAHVWAA